MSIIHFSNKIKFFLELIRFDKPIGFMLLLWPCWFALASIKIDFLINLKWYIYFFIGAFLMRSAGCIINDIVDINIDKKIKRTSKRPLTAKKISLTEALCLLFLFLLFSFLILIQFKLITILIGLLSIPLIIAYPFMKRITNWPQLFLGIAFSWGVLIVSVQFNNYLTLNSLILFLGCIFWTLAYDTIYAYQDREGDITNNIKSTAVIFGNNGKKYVILFYIIFLLILGYIGFQNSNTINSILALIVFLIITMIYLSKWNLSSPNSSNKYFKLNNYFGLICFVYLSIF